MAGRHATEDAGITDGRTPHRRTPFSLTRKVTKIIVHSSVPLRTRGAHTSRSRAAALLVLPLTIGLLLGAVSCANQPSELTTPCGVVVDGSGSGLATKDGFDAEKKLKETLIPFLKDQKCGTVEFAPITANSLGSSCKVEQVDLDPAHGPTTDIDAERRRALSVAAKESLDELKCARDDSDGSDVWGGIDRIAEKMPDAGPSAKLLVVSDFEQRDPEFALGRDGNIATDAKRRSTVNGLVRQRGVPGVEGMEIFPVGYGMKYAKKPSEQKQFEAFWTEALEGRAKAHVNTEYQ